MLYDAPSVRSWNDIILLRDGSDTQRAAYTIIEDCDLKRVLLDYHPELIGAVALGLEDNKARSSIHFEVICSASNLAVFQDKMKSVFWDRKSFETQLERNLEIETARCSFKVGRFQIILRAQREPVAQQNSYRVFQSQYRLLNKASTAKRAQLEELCATDLSLEDIFGKVFQLGEEPLRTLAAIEELDSENLHDIAQGNKSARLRSAHGEPLNEGLSEDSQNDQGEGLHLAQMKDQRPTDGKLAEAKTPDGKKPEGKQAAGKHSEKRESSTAKKTKSSRSTREARERSFQTTQKKIAPPTLTRAFEQYVRLGIWGWIVQKKNDTLLRVAPELKHEFVTPELMLRIIYLKKGSLREALVEVVKQEDAELGNLILITCRHKIEMGEYPVLAIWSRRYRSHDRSESKSPAPAHEKKSKEMG